MELIPIDKALLFNIMLLCFVLGTLVGAIIGWYLRMNGGEK
jgi:F0F1-type ATP synthase assembly protein I